MKGTDQEPDLVLVKKALQTKSTPLRSHFTDKRHNSELISQQLCLKNGMTCQLEQPTATRIRQLEQKVVLSTLCPAVVAVCHETAHSTLHPAVVAACHETPLSRH
jgi:hypothetical protein